MFIDRFDAVCIRMGMPVGMRMNYHTAMEAMETRRLIPHPTDFMTVGDRLRRIEISLGIAAQETNMVFKTPKARPAPPPPPPPPVYSTTHPLFVFEDSYIMAVGHGGGCCGMTHIKPFYIGPDRLIKERKSYPKNYPVQTGAERLAAVIRTLENARPSGILEVVLIPSEVKLGWDKVLTEVFDFKLVTEHRNSNSGNLLSVFHRCSGGKGVRKIPAVFSYPKKEV